MGSIFKSEDKRAQMKAWCERFRARIPAPTTTRRVATRCGDTHVLIGGPVDGPPLVLLHGAMSSSAHALVEAAPLLERFRVYAVDIVGQSPWSADHRPRVDTNELGEWLVDVLDQLELSRAAVLGISWGGFVAIRLAVVAPTRISKLALLVPAGVVKSPAWEGFVRVGWPMTKYLLAPSPARRAAFLRHMLSAPDVEWEQFLGDAFLAYDMKLAIPKLATVEELQALQAPVFVTAAERDASFPGAAVLARSEELFPVLVQRELIPGSNHCPPTTPEHRAWYSARITEFLHS